MDDEHRENYGRHSGSSSERIIFYVDDASAGDCHDSSPEFYLQTDNVLCPSNSESLRLDDRVALYPPSPDSTCFQPDVCSSLYPPSSVRKQRRANSICSQSSGPRHSKHNLEVDQRSSRRSSVQSGRSKACSCGRPSPLGDGRRSSVSRKGRPRRASNARRKDSVRPTKTKAKEIQKAVEDARMLEQARRHRRIATIVLVTFTFLLGASVLAVIVTLTHSSFLSPVDGPKDLTEHRMQNTT